MVPQGIKKRAGEAKKEPAGAKSRAGAAPRTPEEEEANKARASKLASDFPYITKSVQQGKYVLLLIADDQ